MKIRNQNLLLILPLFLLMSLSAGGWDYLNRTEETIAGLQEEAMSLSNSIAEFVPTDLAINIDRYQQKQPELFSQPLEKLLAYEQIKSIHIHSPSMETVFTKPKESTAYVWKLKPDQLTELKGRNAIVTKIETVDDEKVVSSLSGVVSATGNLVGIIQVDIDATVYSKLVEEILAKNFILILFSLSLGFIVSTFISKTISKKLAQLTDSALRVAKGNYSTTVDAGTIQEVEDLSNTFNTMSSVLGDVLEKAQRTLVESEIFRENNILNETFREDIDLTRKIRFKDGFLYTVPSPYGSPVSIISTEETKQGVYAIFLKLKSNKKTDLDASFSLNSILHYLRSVLKQHSMSNISFNGNLFAELEEGKILAFENGSLFTYNLLNNRKEVMTEEASIVIGDFPEGLDQIFLNYMKTYPNEKYEKIQDYQHLWPEQAKGAVIIFQHTARAATAQA